MNERLFDVIEATGGENLPLLRDRGETFPWRKKGASPQALFPPHLIRE